MKKYKVTVVELLLKNNKVAKGNDFVSEDELASSAEDLIEKGFIKRPSKSELETLRKEGEGDEGFELPNPLGANGGAGAGIVVKTYKQMKKDELQAELTKREISFDAEAVNADLIKLLEDNDELNKEKE
jgi:hypothetical protein